MKFFRDETKGIKWTYKSLHFEYELLLMLQDTRLNVPGHLVLSFIGGRARLRSHFAHFGGVAPSPNGLCRQHQRPIKLRTPYNNQLRREPEQRSSSPAIDALVVHLFRVKNNPGRFAAGNIQPE